VSDSREHWERHWDRYSDSTRLNPGQLFRRRMIFRLLGDEAGGEGASILDIGCGSGDLLSALAGRYPNASLAGVDQSQSGLNIAAREIPGARLATANLESAESNSSELGGWASHAVCSEILEHIAEPVEVLTNVAAYLKPGGCLVVTVPGGPMSAFDHRIGHRGHYTVTRLREELEQAGYRIDAIAAAGFPMFNLYRLVVLMRGERLADDIDGQPSLLARTVMALFRSTMWLTTLHSPWGWQIVARAQKP